MRNFLKSALIVAPFLSIPFAYASDGEIHLQFTNSSAEKLILVGTRYGEHKSGNGSWIELPSIALESNNSTQGVYQLNSMPTDFNFLYAATTNGQDYCKVTISYTGVVKASGGKQGGIACHVQTSAPKTYAIFIESKPSNS